MTGENLVTMALWEPLCEEGWQFLWEDKMISEKLLSEEMDFILENSRASLHIGVRP